MKLSELTTDKAMDVMVIITPLIAEIAGDEEAVKAIGKPADVNGLNLNGVRVVKSERLASFIQVLLKNHRKAIFNIIGALNGQTAEEVAQQKFTETLRQIQDDIDEDFVNFIKSFMPAAKKESSPQSANVPAISRQKES